MRPYADLAGVEVGHGFPARVVGAINVSPESFFRGSIATRRRALAQRARQMAADGAAIIDVGAMSTAPYKRGWIEAGEEQRRVVAAIRVIHDVVGIPISVDTQRAAVAEAAMQAGASIINDVSGLSGDPHMADVARTARGVILMAIEARPSRVAPIRLVTLLLRACLSRARVARVHRKRIVLDPGIGFFRNARVRWDQFDCAVLRELRKLTVLGQPLLVGVSRKSFIGKLTQHPDPNDRLYGSVAAAAIAVLNGAHLVRAHDVAASVDAVRIAEAIRNAS